jgi:hypothetical protein
MLLRSVSGRRTLVVFPGLVPGIHVLEPSRWFVDGRDKPGQDELDGTRPQNRLPLSLIMLQASRRPIPRLRFDLASAKGP